MRNGSGYAVPYSDSRSLQRPPKNGAPGVKGAATVSEVFFILKYINILMFSSFSLFFFLIAQVQL